MSLFYKADNENYIFCFLLYKNKLDIVCFLKHFIKISLNYRGNSL